MKRKSKKKQQEAFSKNLEMMTNMRIGRMDTLAEKKDILFLYEPSTRLYFVFDKKTGSSLQTSIFSQAEQKFKEVTA